MPIKFLRRLIGLYGDSMRWLVPEYLDHMMDAFTANQNRMRKAAHGSLGDIFPFDNLEEMGKQNMAKFESAMKIFTPYGPESTTGTQTSVEPDSLETLKAQVDRLQQQLDAIGKTDPRG